MPKLRLAICAALAIVGSALLLGPAAAAKQPRQPPEPPVTIPKPELEASFHCHGEVEDASVEPLLFVTGTGASGEQGYLIGQGAFEAFGHPVCDVDFPDYTTADIQVSVQYLVYAIRREYALAGRQLAIIGISQGGLLPRFALTYWPSLRTEVSDVLAAAGTQHGTTIGAGSCSATVPCPPAFWQQAAGSNLLEALNAQPLEAPGPTAWTTVRSATDEAVQPQTGKHPTSSLKGATNILIQAICPGRVTTHIGTAVDSVTFAAFADAISHRGAAKVSRLPADVCAHPYAPGLDETRTAAFLGGAGGLIGTQEASAPRVPAEPKVRAYVKRPMVE
ncbi:MAG: esterase/lipase family protein [Solirubrobacterales bacterium]